MQSAFRRWKSEITKPRGPQPNWPAVLCGALQEVYLQERRIERPYRGEVFIDRDDWEQGRGMAEKCDAPGGVNLSEDLYTYATYDRCHFGSTASDTTQGCLRIGSEEIFLMGYQWPTEDGASDLVGMSKTGGLVVFECKGPENKETPLAAALQGLDYVTAFSCPSNFIKITRGFMTWRLKLELEDRLPDEFRDVYPDRDAKPMVVVMAPADYYFGSHSRSPKGFFGNQRTRQSNQSHWPEFARAFRAYSSVVMIRFAVCSFHQTTSASWLEEYSPEA